ncbi:methyltransferase domain-containing protein [Roseiarcaceae bacterium H3SJ34-1]|uniref:class I SAM-dependent DNA methyltransferase n=1 Tax=Terripilifer ovatus TaxID=3032367 RepID=UPI003AB9583E|nr:methyltransferase domain-containing protein [Roseiarcaceae bacterium H3SJ34-1]
MAANLEAQIQSSGNIVLDRRYAWAKAEAEDGAHAAAADILDQIVAEAPRWAAAWFALGVAREKAGDKQGAAVAFQRLAELDAEGLFGALLHLARLGVTATPERAPESYVRGLFDQYAARFEMHLVDELGYCGPALLRDALRRAAGDGGFQFRNFIDLGCGTGLMARALSPHFDHAAGVDLAPLMIGKARKTGLYARLETGDLAAFLRNESTGSADLVIAADVFIYLGSLDEVFSETARVLGQGGLFAFSVQTGDDSVSVSEDGWALGKDLRYAHSENYLRRLAAQTGFDIVLLEAASVRRDAGRDVPGLVCVLLKA